MFLYYSLLLLKVYIPILLGIGYVLGYERKKLNNLLKYFVVAFHLQILETIIENSIGTQIPELIIVPIYGYLSLFHYAYSEVIYDVLFSSLYVIALQKYSEINKQARNSVNAARQMKQQGYQVEIKLGRVSRWIVDVFKQENIYLLK